MPGILPGIGRQPLTASGVGVLFPRQNINTMAQGGPLMENNTVIGTDTQGNVANTSFTMETTTFNKWLKFHMMNHSTWR
jgi:hypothetical protein